MPRYLLFFLVICSCSVSPQHNDLSDGRPSPNIKIVVSKSEYGGFGYDIEMNGKLLVHQPNVPIIAGHRGFATEQEAKNIAALVVLKIKNNEMPPTLTSVELAECLKSK